MVNNITDDPLAEDETWRAETSMPMLIRPSAKKNLLQKTLLVQHVVPHEGAPHESIPEVPKSDKRLKGESSRTLALSDNTKEVRVAARLATEQGYYVSQ